MVPDELFVAARLADLSREVAAIRRQTQTLLTLSRLKEFKEPRRWMEAQTKSALRQEVRRGAGRAPAS